MIDLNQVSIKVKNYKCFGNDDSGFDEIKPINIIIGRNNTGKSSLLDIIEYSTTCNHDKILSQSHKRYST